LTEVLEAIVDGVDRVDEGLKSINDVADQQASSAQEISTMVDEVASVSEETTEQAETVADAAKEATTSINQVSDSAGSLADRTQELKTMLAEFDIEGGGGRQEAPLADGGDDADGRHTADGPTEETDQ
jgi:methyl-accepting chemotaxis protein